MCNASTILINKLVINSLSNKLVFNSFHLFTFCLQKGEFDWSKSTTSGMLSSYYYGYIVLQIPGGWLASRFGGSRVIAVAMLMSSIATLLLPVATRQSESFVYILRVILGLFAVSMVCLSIE